METTHHAADLELAKAAWALHLETERRNVRAVEEMLELEKEWEDE